MPKKETRSARLRKYQKAYDDYMKLLKRKPVKRTSGKKHGNVTTYQSFVKKLSAQAKYKKMSPKSRLRKIATEWKKR